MSTMSPESSIEVWIQEQIFFITGGSGFVGIGLLHKLLRCGCKKIYILIRPKKGQTPEERLDGIINDSIFDIIRQEYPDLRSRITAIAGDVTEIDLGISDKDRTTLQNEVTVVLHAAASINFDDPLTKAVFTNLRPTRDVVELARGMKKLQILNYVSTAYCNFDHINKIVEERPYPAKIGWKSLINAAETMTEEELSTLESKLVGELANTYIFTKQISESIIVEAAETLPVVISRPPIVNGAWQEPEPGWIRTLSSPIAICMASGKGILRCYYGAPDKSKAYTSTDDTVNTIITSSWRHAVFRDDDLPNPPVYHISYFGTIPAYLLEISLEVERVHPAHNSIWPTKFFFMDGPYIFLLGHLLLHFLPGLFIDMLLKFKGSKTRLTRIYRKLYVAMTNLRPFLLCNDRFALGNIMKLEKVIPDQEKEKFPLDFSHNKLRDKKVYLQFGTQICYGFRKLMGEPPKASKQDFIHRERLKWIERIFTSALYLSVIYYFPYHYIWSLVAYIESTIAFVFYED